MGSCNSEGVFGLDEFEKRREGGEERFCVDGCVTGGVEAIVTHMPIFLQNEDMAASVRAGGVRISEPYSIVGLMRT